MIVSHKYRYIFIQIPFTASSAIGRELCEMYAGEEILRKHAYYHEFEKIASDEGKKYFVFAGIRNPLDTAVTKYFKLKTNHNQLYTRPQALLKHDGSVSKADLGRFAFIHRNDADFAAYFQKFHKLPYVSILSVSRKHCDFVLHYECLQEGFSRALELMGVEQKRLLPHLNPTAEKESNFIDYYTPEIRNKAVRVFGPSMKRWGYSFPAEWGPVSVLWLHQLEYRLVYLIKTLAWRYVRRSPHFYGRLFRQVR